MWHIEPYSPVVKADKKLTELYSSLNPKGQEKLLGYAGDMVRSGKYKKTARIA